MLKTEIYGEVDGMTLVRRWSDDGMMIAQDGTDLLYVEAVDPDFMNRTYTETDIPIETGDEWGETVPDPEEGESLEELGVPEEEPGDEGEDGDEHPTEPEEGGTGSTIPLKPSKKY